MNLLSVATDGYLSQAIIVQEGTGLPYPVPVTISGVNNILVDNCAGVDLMEAEAEVTLIKVDSVKVIELENKGENI